MEFIKIEKQDLDTLSLEKYASIAGVLLGVKEIKTRSGKYMAFLDIDDGTTNAEIVVFPQVWASVKNLGLKEADIVKAKVKVEQTDPQLKLILNKIEKVILDEMDP